MLFQLWKVPLECVVDICEQYSCFVSVFISVERGREQRERDSQPASQPARQTDRQTERERERESKRERERQTNRQTDQTDRQTQRQKKRQKDRETDRQKERWKWGACNAIVGDKSELLWSINKASQLFGLSIWFIWDGQDNFPRDWSLPLSSNVEDYKLMTKRRR